MTRNFLNIILVLQTSFLWAQDWVPLDKGIECFFNGDVKKMYVDSVNDKLYVTGIFNQDGNCVSMHGAACWNGTKWDSIGNANGGSSIKFPIYRYHDTLFMYGNFYPIFNYHLAKWNGVNWDTLTNGPNSQVMDYVEKDGVLYLCGAFDRCGDSTFILGQYNGTSFSGSTPYYMDISSFGWTATSIAVYKDTLYVGGNFYLPTSNFSDFAKYYNGDLQTVSNEFIGATPSYIESMVVYRDELYIGGYFRKQDGFTGDYIMKWNGHEFSEVGGGVNARVNTMRVHDDRLYVGGYFTQAGDSATTYLAIWDGSAWTTFNDTFSNFTIIRDINFYRDSLIISGHFFTLNGDSAMGHIAKYNHALPKRTITPPSQTTLALYPNPSPDLLTLNLQIAEAQNISIRIYDTRGRLVDIVLDETKAAGNYSIPYQFDKLNRGVYFVTFQSAEGITTQKVIRY